MKSPQKENGYTPIANELLEAIIMRNFPPNARSIIDLIFRRTYGFSKKSCQTSISFICQATRLDRGSVNRSIRYLLFHRILTRGVAAPRQPSTYSIQKDYDKWTVPIRGGTASTFPQEEVCHSVSNIVLEALPCEEGEALPCEKRGALLPPKKTKNKKKIILRARASSINDLKEEIKVLLDIGYDEAQIKKHLLETREIPEATIDEAFNKNY